MGNSCSKDFIAGLYRTLYTIRVFETECVNSYRQAKIKGYFHPCLGQEGVATGVCSALEPTDYIVTTHRGHGHCIAKGAALPRMVAELFGKQTGYCLGWGGSMHIADLEAGILGANGIVGAGLPIGVGAALASRLRGDNRVTVVFVSDGGVNNGIFGEALNLAAIWSLPLLVVIENNQYAVSTSIEQSTRDPELYRRGAALGVPSRQVDGNDVVAVYEASRGAVDACRQGGGPLLIEAKTFRQGGHHVNDPGAYMPKDRVAHYKERDPVTRCRLELLRSGATHEEVLALESAVVESMAQAVNYAAQSPEMPVEEFLELTETY